MSLAVVYTRAQVGIDSPLVTVEVHLSNGLPSLSIVGLPEAAVKESKDRVRGALLNSKFEFPARRITINLAPADLPKEGSRFDLAIAIGVLVASGQLPETLINQHEFIGELALGGELRSVRGVLPASIMATKSNRKLLVAIDNADEAALVEDSEVISAGHLLDVCAYLHGQHSIDFHSPPVQRQHRKYAEDLVDVKGQQHARRALEIAAAGGHSLLMIGPPGTGKTLLASRLPSILPQMQQDEAMESAAIASISDKGFQIENWMQRNFRQPHHTASGVALVGGGSNPRPGEVSLAHHGVLFLDHPRLL